MPATEPSLFRYVALGDSTSVGVGANADGGFPERLARRLKANGVPVGILNFAVSGARAVDAEKQAERVASRRPHLVTLGIGSNDTWRLVSEDAFARSLEKIATRLESSGASVVVCTIPDLGKAPAATVAQAWLGVRPEQISERVRLLNHALLALANRPRFTIADVHQVSRTELPLHPEYFSPDGFHPSSAGYDFWAEVCWPAVWRVASTWLDARQQA